MSLYTEQEAAEKWCPNFRYAVAGDGGSYTNRPIARSLPFCIGSRCMAWRWAIEEGRARGYCGAFGKVEP